MSRSRAKPREKRRCRQCGERETRSATGKCLHCRPSPTVSRDGDAIYIDGLGHLTIHAALCLAHSIADAVTP
jgi:hypothetical protein